MVGRSTDGKVTAPVRRVRNPAYGSEEGAPEWLPSEPHVGGTVHAEQTEETVPTGFVRGGTTNPIGGVSGEVEQLDNDGRVVAVDPAEVARVQREQGSQAAARRLAGG